jgi:NAD(P)-dependent dehydrogenase (short-subunit alcohol dehydrogenase family)
MSSIAGQHVVVLGGTSGFGFATAQAAAAAGARVSIASRSADKLRGALDRLGNGASGACVDVTDKPALEAYFGNLGAFDHLAVTVGDAMVGKPILELTDVEARAAFEVRFWGQFKCSPGGVSAYQPVGFHHAGVRPRRSAGDTRSWYLCWCAGWPGRDGEKLRCRARAGPR